MRFCFFFFACILIFNYLSFSYRYWCFIFFCALQEILKKNRICDRKNLLLKYGFFVQWEKWTCSLISSFLPSPSLGISLIVFLLPPFLRNKVIFLACDDIYLYFTRIKSRNSVFILFVREARILNYCQARTYSFTI